MLLLSAALLATIACTKENENSDNNAGASQSEESISTTALIGTYGYPSSHALTGKDFVIVNDSIVTFDNMTYTWSISGNHFTATNGRYYKMEFDITAISSKEMTISGSTWRYYQNDDEWRTQTDLSGTLVKTVTEVLTTLPDDIITGDWTFSGTLGSGWPLQVSDDHTCVWNYNFTCNWSTNGTTFNARGTGNYPRFKMQFTVDSITTSATQAILYVNGDYKDSVYRISGWEETGDELVGTFTRRF